MIKKIHTLGLAALLSFLSIQPALADVIDTKFPTIVCTEGMEEVVTAMNMFKSLLVKFKLEHSEIHFRVDSVHITPVLTGSALKANQGAQKYVVCGVFNNE